MIPILFLFFAFLAEIIGAIAGFGTSTILLPIALFFFDFPTALIVVALLHVSGNLSKVALFKEGVDRNLLLRFGFPSIVLTLVGAFLVAYLPSLLLKSLLGLFLVIYALVSLLGVDIKVKQNLGMDLLGGSLSGFFAGLLGTGGAVRGAFLSSYRLRKEKYIATLAVIALAVDGTRILVYLGKGYFPSELYYSVPLLVFIAFAGAYAGRKMMLKISQQWFRKMVLIAIGLAGLKFVWDSIALAVTLIKNS